MSHLTVNRASRWPLALLLVLGALPLLPAVGRMLVRFVDMGAPPEMLADTSRFFVMPVPLVVHVICGCLFTLLGALQFSGALRRGPWHRRSGRILVAAGVLAAITALWLTQFYPHAGTEGPLLYWFRLAAGTGMLVAAMVTPAQQETVATVEVEVKATDKPEKVREPVAPVQKETV